MWHRLYRFRFELFLVSLLALVFGALVSPGGRGGGFISTTLVAVTQLVGLLVVSKRRRWVGLLGIILVASIWLSVTDILQGALSRPLQYTFLGITFLFYALVALEIIRQVWATREIDHKVLFGLGSGYLCIGLLGFLLCSFIELSSPGSFQGLDVTGQSDQGIVDRMIYFSFVTLLTIGYGDIIPVTMPAQKVVILIGLAGQFYFVIFTATIVGKFVSGNYVQYTDDKSPPS